MRTPRVEVELHQREADNEVFNVCDDDLRLGVAPFTWPVGD